MKKEYTIQITKDIPPIKVYLKEEEVETIVSALDMIARDNVGMLVEFKNSNNKYLYQNYYEPDDREETGDELIRWLHKGVI